MEVPIRYFRVNNDIRPHCLRCGKNYRLNDRQKTCSEMFGFGKRRRLCEGEIVTDLYLDWSINLIKDYSVMQYGDLSFYDEIWSKIESKMREARGSGAGEAGVRKINVTRELEILMRLKGINLINLVGQRGDLITKSVYKVPMGHSYISNYGREDLMRFEKVSMTVGEKESDDLGYMNFKEVDYEETKKSIDNTLPKDEDLVCKACGFIAKSKFGLQGHLRKHESDLQEAIEVAEQEEAHVEVGV